MDHPDAPELPLDHQRRVFHELVSCQDGGMPVDTSRLHTATSFDITVEALKQIESLGIQMRWPPLD